MSGSPGQEHFVRRHAQEWARFETTLERLGDPTQGRTRGRSVLPSAQDTDFPQRYRQICQQLALARKRRYSSEIVDRLNRMALRGHTHLYRRPPGSARRLADYLLHEIPLAVRREWRLVSLAHLLFYGSGLAVFLAIQVDPDLVYTLIDPAQVAQIEDMYEPGGEVSSVQRSSDSDLMMFGFYIRNNIGIAFRTFAGGALLGLGSLFFLLFNGLFMGAVFGHLHHIGYGETLYPFVVGHGSFELTAIVLSAAAGLRLGSSWIAPGNRTRAQAFLEAARRTTPILYGFFAMLFIAAFIEAFWSSKAVVPVNVKYAVGAVLWVLVYGWLLLGGRRAA
ncbi:MAG: stage II sporulation protein M [Myxococcota bacterium]|nr:stage II sporulation protein M [Myxococcota bacterium]